MFLGVFILGGRRGREKLRGDMGICDFSFGELLLGLEGVGVRNG